MVSFQDAVSQRRSRLSPAGVETGTTDPAYVDDRPAALRGLEAATSGKAFLGAVSGGRLTPLIDSAPAPVQWAVDNFLSPIGLASLIAAPITGGTSLGLSGAAGVAARLGTRFAAEAGVTAAASFAGKKVAENIPEDAPGFIKLGAPLVAGIATGAGVGSAIRKASNTGKAVARTELADVAKPYGRNFIGPVGDHEILKADVGSDNRVYAAVMSELGIDPSAAAKGIARDRIALERNYDIDNGLTTAVLAASSPTGYQSFTTDAKGFLTNVEKAKGIHLADMMEYDDAPTRFGFTPMQTQEFNNAHKVVDDVENLLDAWGISRPKRELAEGKKHFPRSAGSRGGEKFIAPSDPVEKRLWELAADAANAGRPIEYDGIAGTLRGYLKAALDEVAEKQFENSVMNSGIRPPVAARATNEGRIAWTNHNRAAAAVKQAQNKLNAATVKGDEVAINEANTELAAAMAKRIEADGEWTNTLNKQFSHLPGKLFGLGQDVVPVSTWRGIGHNKGPVYFRVEDVHKLHEWFDSRNLAGPKFPALVSGMQKTGDLMRFTAATADFSAPAVQGLPLLAHDPVAWGKMATQQFKAFFQPETQGRYIADNYDTITDMIVNGRVSPGDIEMFKSLERGGIAEQALRLPGVNRTVAPGVKAFQRSYDTVLLITRAELWKAMKPRWTGTPEELGRTVRNMTGGLEPRGLGVGGTQRALESMFLFAPKMLRATLALTAQAMQPWTPDGAEAAHTILRLMGAGMGAMALANVGIGLAAGETEEQLDKRLEDALNPLNGRQFLGVRVGDTWYGMGGQFRSATQLVSRAIADPSLLTTGDAVDNPLIRYAGGRLSPGAQVGLSGYELLTGEEHNVLPYEDVDDVGDVIRLAGTGMLPFAAQSLTEVWDNPNASPLVEMLGARTSPATPSDMLNAESWRTYNMPFSDLTATEQNILKERNPAEAEKLTTFGDKAEKQYRAETVKTTDMTNRSLLAMNEAVQTNQLDRTEFRERVSGVLHDRYLRNLTARETIGVDFGEAADTPKRRVLDAYYDTFKQAGYTEDGGQVDWNRWDTLNERLKADVAAGKYGPPARAQQYLDERTRYEPPAEVKWFFDNKDYIEESGYWTVKDAQIQRLAPRLAKLGVHATTASELEQAVEVAAARGDRRTALQLRALGDRLDYITTTEHAKMRKKDPRLTRALIENGYIETPKRDVGRQI